MHISEGNFPFAILRYLFTSWYNLVAADIHFKTERGIGCAIRIITILFDQSNIPGIIRFVIAKKLGEVQPGCSVKNFIFFSYHNDIVVGYTIDVKADIFLIYRKSNSQRYRENATAVSNGTINWI